MKKYIFGYLFVRIAKLLAVLTILAGIGYALFRLEQASIAAQSASYQPSSALSQSLANLKDTLVDATRLVSVFCAQNGGTAPTPHPVAFPESIEDNDDFARLAGDLDQVDQFRRQLKDALVTRFEELVQSTESKLRAHAAEVAPAVRAGVPSGALPSPTATPQPTPVQENQADTLYTGQVNNYDIQQRTSVLDRGADFLKVLESSAEDPNNRQTLTDSVAQLEALAHLLPAKMEAPSVAEQPVQPGRTYPAPAPHRELNAEKVADQLARLRGSVRQAMLTAWTLDAAYAQAADSAGTERARCRVASLTVKGIWLAAFGQLGLALLVALFVAFLVLVLADFMQTLLDTATNTGVMASASRPDL